MNKEETVIIEFPLRGEWVAPHTPGHKVPSHGTDALGQRYAFDFYRIEDDDFLKFYRGSRLVYFLFGIPLKKCLCYKEKIYSPVNGKVIAAKDGMKEPERLHPIYDLLKIIFRTIYFGFLSMIKPAKEIDLQKFIGNYIIIEFENKYAFFAHLHPGSIRVKEGQTVNINDIIGLVGHTGNSTAPHLHFHVMDSPDLLKAKGIKCLFRKYNLQVDNAWIEIENNIPNNKQVIHY
jgi:murein DD-endopeptidase MepM/ murein hydrolase activator NlpD